MPASFIQLEVTADPSLFDDLVGLMSFMGFDGFWEEQTALRCYVPADRWHASRFGALEAAVLMVAKAHGLPAARLTVTSVEDRNWNAAWESSLQPIRVAGRILIAPTWQSCVPAPGEIVVRIDPKMSFGTGHHETTRMVLTLMEPHVSRTSSVLDVGTGTGILAIASVLLGARSAVALDNDDWACTNARENVRVNGVEHAVIVVPGELSALGPGQFNLVVANLQRDAIEALLPSLHDRLAPGGLLILSGLLLDDEQPVRVALSSRSLRVIEELRENEWLALTAARDASNAGPAPLEER
jgi:ribosomal protein L11 methyltransferase